MSHPDGVDFKSLSLDEVLVKRKSLRRRLSARENLQAVRIAILGGSTTSEIVDFLELCLLDSGLAPVFYESEYGRFETEALHDSASLVAFAPDLVYLHTSYLNLQGFAPLHASEAELDECVQHQVRRYAGIWAAITEEIGCAILQNNFEFPPQQVLGNLDAAHAGGRTRFVMRMNLAFASAAAGDPRLSIQDVCSLSARMGLDRWFDWERYYSYKVLTTVEASMSLAASLNAMICGMYGRARKVLVLDLDNTLWGGVIGDDGVGGIAIGRETPLAEAYTAFQEYCLRLHECGVLLAVCSKNDEAVAKSGFTHPDSVLRLEHIACFRANWAEKPENIQEIARELRLGTESFVFIDDNAAERALVAAQVEGIAVPDMGEDAAQYPSIIQSGRYFEQLSLSSEDLARGTRYKENGRRSAFRAKYADYGEYLDSLEMVAEIEPLNRLHLERMTQLTNKTNQFNLTTRRYTVAEMETVCGDRNAVALQGRLRDQFGDHGLISLVLARKDGNTLDIELWLMSCRVLKREMELAMLDVLVERAREAGVRWLRGRYVATRKNGIVSDHYTNMGFEAEEISDNGGVYLLDVARYVPLNRHIRVLAMARP